MRRHQQRLPPAAVPHPSLGSQDHILICPEFAYTIYSFHMRGDGRDMLKRNLNEKINCHKTT